MEGKSLHMLVKVQVCVPMSSSVALLAKVRRMPSSTGRSAGYMTPVNSIARFIEPSVNHTAAKAASLYRRVSRMYVTIAPTCSRDITCRLDVMA